VCGENVNPDSSAALRPHSRTAFWCPDRVTHRRVRRVAQPAAAAGAARAPGTVGETSNILQGRRPMLLLLLPPLLLAGCTPVDAASPPRPRNFLILFVDDLGYNEINLGAHKPASGGYGGYGGKTQTPHVAQLAAEGLTFTAWYSAWHCCSASRAAMLTGRLPPRTGVDSVGAGVFTASAIGGLPRNETTFAEALHRVGFATAMLGKWHLGVWTERGI
jgi:hypothetical protein